MNRRIRAGEKKPAVEEPEPVPEKEPDLYYALLFITLFILTGFYTFLVETRLPNGTLITARWKDMGPDDKRLYHMIFGIKVLCAFIIFFLASALAGRAKAFASIRKNARVVLTAVLLLGGLVLLCATLLHYLPLPHVPAVTP